MVQTKLLVAGLLAISILNYADEALVEQPSVDQTSLKSEDELLQSLEAVVKKTNSLPDWALSIQECEQMVGVNLEDIQITFDTLRKQLGIPKKIRLVAVRSEVEDSLQGVTPENPGLAIEYRADSNVIILRPHFVQLSASAQIFLMLAELHVCKQSLALQKDQPESVTVDFSEIYWHTLFSMNCASCLHTIQQDISYFTGNILNTKDVSVYVQSESLQQVCRGCALRTYRLDEYLSALAL